MGATITIQANLRWGVVKTARGTLVAICDPLGLTVEADDDAELHSVIAEAQHVLMVDLFEDGELHAFLRDRGWSPNVPLPQVLPEGGVKFDVPFSVEPASASHGHA